MAIKKSLLDEAMRISINNLKTHPKYGGFAHFSFLIQSNKIVEWSTNVFSMEKAGCGHSEVRALKKARGVMSIRKDFDVINTRLNRYGLMRNSYPCKRCRKALKAVGCRSVWYTNDYGWERVFLCP